MCERESREGEKTRERGPKWKQRKTKLCGCLEAHKRGAFGKKIILGLFLEAGTYIGNYAAYTYARMWHYSR